MFRAVLVLLSFACLLCCRGDDVGEILSRVRLRRR